MSAWIQNEINLYLSFCNLHTSSTDLNYACFISIFLNRYLECLRIIERQYFNKYWNHPDDHVQKFNRRGMYVQKAMLRYLPLKHKDKLLLFLSAIRLPIKNGATDSLQCSHFCFRRKSFFIRRTECNVTGSTLAMKPLTLLYSDELGWGILLIPDLSYMAPMTPGRMDTAVTGHTPVTDIDHLAKLLFYSYLIPDSTGEGESLSPTPLC